MSLFEIRENTRPNFFHRFGTGDDILVDGDMETAGVGAWTVGSSATLTKETGTPHGGTQVLRVAYNGSANPSARQQIMTVGLIYEVKGWARSDGTSIPRVFDSGTAIWTGTNSTSWQEIDVARLATSVQIRLFSFSSAGYTEFDDCSIRQKLSTEDESTINFIRNP